ncbi:MAG: DUF177 domain-containing protein, partial [Bacteroidia bacterium]|nr:DUF177 domain-containing protein [Bacteroidia bacterium]
GEGEHEFEYHVDDSFFKKFEHSPVQHGDVEVLVVVEKKENMLKFDFTMGGELIVSCDRCLEDLELELESYNELIVKFGEVKAEQEVAEDVVILPSKERELDISRFIYEYITLLIPMRNVHEDENGDPTCDPQILKELGKHGVNPEGEHPSDPRWDALKNINLN